MCVHLFVDLESFLFDVSNVNYLWRVLGLVCLFVFKKRSYTIFARCAGNSASQHLLDWFTWNAVTGATDTLLEQCSAIHVVWMRCRFLLLSFRPNPSSVLITVHNPEYVGMQPRMVCSQLVSELCWGHRLGVSTQPLSLMLLFQCGQSPALTLYTAKRLQWYFVKNLILFSSCEAWHRSALWMHRSKLTGTKKIFGLNRHLLHGFRSFFIY